MSWLDKEARIQQEMLDIDPAYRQDICEGYYYSALPSHWSKPEMRETLAYIRRIFPEQQPRILDYACGCGQFLLYLWHHGFRKLEGRERNPKYAGTASLLFQRIYPEAAVPVSSVEHKEIYDVKGNHDIITIFGAVYGHGIDIPRALKAFHEALTPGGLLFVNDHKNPKEDFLGWLHDADFRLVLAGAYTRWPPAGQEGDDEPERLDRFYIARKAKGDPT